MDEMFFLRYHMQMTREEFMSCPIHERKYLIHKFIDQKEKENEQLEKARKKKS
jgi:hypothetical protein